MDLPTLKVDLMFEGVRYTPALTEALDEAAPNFYPYRFRPGEHDPTGAGKAPIPYLLVFEDGTLVRLQGNGRSPYRVERSGDGGFILHRGDEAVRPVSFDPRPSWADGAARDGTPLGAAGVDAHGDMLVVNVAPACQYFLHAGDGGGTLRCVFCGYGRPDARAEALGQDVRRVELPRATFERMQDALDAALATGRYRHVYLVGGSLADWREEGERFLALARAAREAVGDRAFLSLGCGALPDDTLERFAAEGLADGICFNLEVWSERLFSLVCPGKARFVGWDRWLRSLYRAAELFPPGAVFTATVAGIELEPEYGGMAPEEAVANALEGSRTLLEHGVTPIWSIYWPLWGATHPERLGPLRDYFVKLNEGYHALRGELGVTVNTDFMCHRCAYMQLECDLDRHRAGGAGE